MAAQSKLSLPSILNEKTGKQLVSDLTDLYLRHRSQISKAIYIGLFLALFNRIRNAVQEQKTVSRQAAERRKTGTGALTSDTGGRKKVELNREFFRNLARLLRICIPGWKSKELRLIVTPFFCCPNGAFAPFVMDLRHS